MAGCLNTWIASLAFITLHVNSVWSNLPKTGEASQDIIELPALQLDTDNTSLTKAEFILFLTEVDERIQSFIQADIGPCQPSADHMCLQKDSCPSVEDIFQAFATNGKLHANRLADALPVTFQTLTSPNCSHRKKEDGDRSKSKSPTTAETWGYGIAFTSIVIAISNIGAFLGPLMEKTFFQRVLQFLVAMGCGSLAATGLLVLIPEAFHMMAAKELGNDYIWKSTVAVFSIYLFFVCERILKTFFHTRSSKKQTPNDRREDSDDVTPDIPLTLKSSENGHGHSHGPIGMNGEESAVSTLAWMVMAGDVIHNSVDGLAIGAAFSTNISVGISVSLAVVCEELPHELADVAILLHSGFRLRKAILINFISACFIYMGLIIGIFVGSSAQDASRWIFALAGGLFLYVPLVDMLPEMSSHLDKELAKGGNNAMIVACLHIVGLIIGTCIIIMIVNVSPYIVV